MKTYKMSFQKGCGKRKPPHAVTWGGADYRGLCRRWLLTVTPPRLCRLTLTVILPLRLGLQVQAIDSPPFARIKRR